MTTKSSGESGVPLFLAHALALETDAMTRYGDLADILEAHNNTDVASLFQDMKRYARLHADEIRTIAEGVGGLPHLAPWDYVWLSAEPPEVAPFEDVHYLMTPRQALSIALECERRAEAYYRSAGAGTTDPEVARLAAAFAEEEAEHVALLQRRFDLLPKSETPVEDLDGPRSPD